MLMSKTLIFLLILLRSFEGAGQSLPENGVYWTKDDFDNNELSFSSAEKIAELPWGDIRLIFKDSEQTLRFGEFYGYRDGGFKFYSFGQRKTFGFFGYYKVLDQSPLIIYKQRVPRLAYLYDEKPHFSLSENSKKYTLTVHHLKKHARLDNDALKKIKNLKRHGSLTEIINGKTLINSLLIRDKWSTDKKLDTMMKILKADSSSVNQ